MLSHRKISPPRDLLLVLGLFLTYRLLYSGMAWLAADAHIAFTQWALRHPTYQIRPLVVPDWSPLWEHLLDAWYRWDTGWYLKIAALGYDAAKMLADAIERADSVDPDKIKDAINSTTDFPGITGMITLDEKRNPYKEITIATVKNGKFELVTKLRP